jgi:hypothetical protein
VAERIAALKAGPQAPAVGAPLTPVPPKLAASHAPSPPAAPVVAAVTAAAVHAGRTGAATPPPTPSPGHSGKAVPRLSTKMMALQSGINIQALMGGPPPAGRQTPLGGTAEGEEGGDADELGSSSPRGSFSGVGRGSVSGRYSFEADRAAALNISHVVSSPGEGAGELTHATMQRPTVAGKKKRAPKQQATFVADSD